ncbi:Sodium-dependent dopamine transporter [Orchesella cincta]|uniref:Sodium-dependent dopamine transporter n=1 Tax=Orchesella cincta TaxID=48709 RepID=A0A1D2NIS1_ORCCI|nr:Sodium-dependent dopamine transporter [Orchesella cincta]
MTEVKAENNEIKEESVITPVPPEEELSPTPEPVVEVIREQRIIVPKVILPPAIDPEIEAVLLEEEDENDLNQHFFIDQVHWQRPTWGNSWWFGRCAMIALAVDMSAIQSFPRHVANQGGIIFIVMYVLCLCVFGYPGVVFEGLIGQHFQTGMLGIWGLVPLLRGIGVAVFSSSLVFAALAPSNVMWSAIMMIDSCKALATGHLPWESCNNKCE